MKDWKYHYNQAEEMLKRANEPVLQHNQKHNLLLKAQVHATLATIGVTDEKGSRFLGSMSVFS